MPFVQSEDVLTMRQDLILRLVVEEHLVHGRPVASKSVAEAPDIGWAPSTVRSELASLEEAGYLTHPHTSAGRVPTETGYRRYVDQLISSGQLSARPRVELELSRLRHEIDETMRRTTAALAQVTDLVALVTAPPLTTATIHRVEVLRLRPSVVLVVVITSTGVVTKRVFDFGAEVDPGLVEWASSYMNERLIGLGVGARMLSGRLADPELGPVEAAFVNRLAEAFTDLGQDTSDDLYIDGTARLLSESSGFDRPGVDKVIDALEGRAAVFSMLRSVLDEHSMILWIGAENPRPELRDASVVGANYGLGHRNLGTVGVVGPMRMDYATAIVSVRDAARELSHYFEVIYES